MHRRVNITLPETTIRLIDRVAKRGDRSRLIATAVESYVKDMGREALRKQLQEGALRRADQSRALAAEWFPLEDEAWSARKL
jgi:CopG family transcriptional regulator/antitoxin EndoAI